MVEQRYVEDWDRPVPQSNSGLSGAVGGRAGAPNRVADQNAVMALLNKIPSQYGGTLHPTGPTNFKAPREGTCDPTLSTQISTFQRTNALPVVDGVVDPGGATWRVLNTLAAGGPLLGRQLPSRPAGPEFRPTAAEWALYDQLDLILRMVEVTLRGPLESLNPRLRPMLIEAKASIQAALKLFPAAPNRPKKPLPVQSHVGVLTQVMALFGMLLALLELIRLLGPHIARLLQGLIAQVKAMIEAMQETVEMRDLRIAGAAVGRIENILAGVKLESKSDCDQKQRNFRDRTKDLQAGMLVRSSMIKMQMNSWLKALGLFLECLKFKHQDIYNRIIGNVKTILEAVSETGEAVVDVMKRFSGNSTFKL